MTGRLLFEDGTTLTGESFGSEKSIAGEIVFSTGMVGYPESFTDPSYKGQILILTYPLVGNYGVPDKQFWESERLQISGLVVSDYIDTPSHVTSQQTLAQWLKKEGIPALVIKDTRMLAQKLRTTGAMLGKIETKGKTSLYDPNKENLVALVSTKKVIVNGKGKKKVLLIDCGAKKNIERSLVERGVEVTTVPWDFDPFVVRGGTEGADERSEGARLLDRRGRTGPRALDFDAIVISNGPGDPKMADKTILTIKKALDKKIPILGVCLGHQLLALAAGGDTYKLKFGHRSQNQPCLLVGTKRCFITTQNHGFAVSDKLPKGFKPWFVNANDGSSEGMMHERLPVMSVQFHPEATPGPVDTAWVFDYFLERI